RGASGPRPITNGTGATLRHSPRPAAVIPVMAARVLIVPPPSGSTAASAKAPAAFGDTMVGVDMRQANNLPITILARRLPRPGSLTEVAVTESYLDHAEVAVSKVVGTELELAEPQ